jgi:hypothetical protein
MRGVPVLLPALSHLRIVLAAAPPHAARLGVQIAFEKGTEAMVARPARHKAAQGLVVQHRDELGALGPVDIRMHEGDSPRIGKLIQG